MNFKRTVLVTVLLLLVFSLLSGCEPATPIEGDGSNKYADGDLKVDHKYYHISGVVHDPTHSVVTGSTTDTSGYGGILDLGSIKGFAVKMMSETELKGKGLVWLYVTASDRKDLAPVGAVVILKVTDYKGAVLFPGDQVNFICRRDYEPVGAIEEGEEFDPDEAGTWELDLCRMESPIIIPAQAVEVQE